MNYICDSIKDRIETTYRRADHIIRHKLEKRVCPICGEDRREVVDPWNDLPSWTCNDCDHDDGPPYTASDFGITEVDR